VAGERDLRSPADGVWDARRTVHSMLWLLRHADAASGSPDSDRRLTKRGVRQSQAAGRALERLGVQIDVCLASPKLRALETARIATERIGVEVRVGARR